MNGILVHTDGRAEEVTFKAFENAQELIGGYINQIGMPNFYLWLDEDGKMKNQAANIAVTSFYVSKGGRALLGLPFVGKVLITGTPTLKTSQTAVQDLLNHFNNTQRMFSNDCNRISRNI